MSLLLDALKKAEEEKRAAFKRLAEEAAKLGAERLRPVQELTLAVYSPEPLPATVIPESAPAKALANAASFVVESIASPPLTREVASQGRVSGGLQSPGIAPGSKWSEDPTVTHELTVQPPPAREKSATKSHIELTLEEPAQPGQQPDDPARFEETRQETVREQRGPARKLEETPPGAAPGVAPDLAKTPKPTPVAAQVVLAATRPRRSDYGLTLGLLVSLCVLALVLFGVFYYYAVTPMARSLPSPLVAKGVEAATAPPVLSEVVTPPTEVVTAAPSTEPARIEMDEAMSMETATEQIVSTDTEPAPVEARALESPDTQVSEMAHVAPVQSPAQEPVREERKPAPTPVREPLAEGKSRAPAGEATAPVTVAAAGTVFPAEIEIPTELIRISRTRQPEDRGVAVQNAYRAYRHGDYAAAEAGYRQVLASQPDNRDALLGMAAVALRLRRFEEAMGYYATLLRFRPRDPIALAALTSLQREGDPLSAESRIKALIDQDPAAPYLHFVLGNLYARQERWAEAQRAFFEAYRGNPEEPDYALNLAVSLDKLNEPQAALLYYRKALSLADAGQANFNTADVMKRIEALAATGGH